MKGICTVLTLAIELTPSEVTAFTSLHRSIAEPGLCKITLCCDVFTESVFAYDVQRESNYFARLFIHFRNY